MTADSTAAPMVESMAASSVESLVVGMEDLTVAPKVE